jgi:hypothetical protein
VAPSLRHDRGHVASRYARAGAENVERGMRLPARRIVVQRGEPYYSLWSSTMPGMNNFR